MPRIYFSGSIRGADADRELYRRLIAGLAEIGEVLTAHVGDPSPDEGAALSDREIHDRDLDWLRSADLLVAEVTTPSLGVGYEIATALSVRVPVYCLYRPAAGRRLSAMIAGSPDVHLIRYRGPAEALARLRGLRGEGDRCPPWVCPRSSEAS